MAEGSCLIDDVDKRISERGRKSSQLTSHRAGKLRNIVCSAEEE